MILCVLRLIISMHHQLRPRKHGKEPIPKMRMLNDNDFMLYKDMY